VVDGALSGYSTLTVFRMLPIVKYHYEASLGVVPLVVGMNKKSWESLSPAAKAAYEKHSGLVMARNGGGGFEKVRGVTLAKIRNSKEHKRLSLSDQEMKKGRELMKPVYASWIKSVPDGQKKFDAYMKILADIRAGR
jgi:TRAP-type C4-dicarboxylate transport system substrate-binding protein